MIAVVKAIEGFLLAKSAEAFQLVHTRKMTKQINPTTPTWGGGRLGWYFELAFILISLVRDSKVRVFLIFLIHLLRLPVAYKLIGQRH